MGLYTSAFAVAFAVGPWAGTLVLARYGSFALWSACLAGGVVSAVCFTRVRATEKCLQEPVGS
jgi:predicted MFS family arabinose efflux permease